MPHNIIAFPPSAIKYTADDIRGTRPSPMGLWDRERWAKALWLMKSQVLEAQGGWLLQEELVYPVRLEWYFKGGKLPLLGGHGCEGAMWDSVIQAFSEGSLHAVMHTDYIRRLDGSGGEHLWPKTSG
jgi:hypothetical protein